MHYCVYKITNLTNGMIYIGQHKTMDLDDGYMGSGTLIRRAIKKHGFENFRKDIIGLCDNFDEMNELEKRLVTEEFVRRNDTYNLCIGGGFHYNGGINPDCEVEVARRKKIRATNKIKFPNGGPRSTPESAAKMGRTNRIRYAREGFHWTGRKHRDETRRKIGEANSISQLGTGNSQHGTMWITNDEYNAKITRGEPIPDGWRAGRVIRTNR